MELHHAEIEAAGLRILAVGLGEPKHARHFGGKLAPNVECLTNEKPTLYEAFGIERGNILRLMAPDLLAQTVPGGTLPPIKSSQYCRDNILRTRSDPAVVEVAFLL